MELILTNLVKNINEIIEKLKQEKIELKIMITNNAGLEDNMGDYLYEIKNKFNDLLTHIDIKMEICELKKKKYEEELCMKNYNLWRVYLENKKQYVDKITEELENIDILSMTEIEDIILSETDTDNNFQEDIYNTYNQLKK